MVVLQQTIYLCPSSANQFDINNFECLQHSSFNSTSNERNSSENIQSRIVSQNKKIAKSLFDICEDCSKIMASIPHGGFAACKLREHFRERELTISRMKKDGAKGNNSYDKNDTKYLISNKKMLEYSPVKYNGKLMNSIWGFYNRYSPHNIKSNDDLNRSDLLQQPFAVAGNAIAKNIAMAMDSAKEWGFIDE